MFYYMFDNLDNAHYNYNLVSKKKSRLTTWLSNNARIFQYYTFKLA